MADPTKTVTNPRIAKLIQYEDKLDATDAAELAKYRALGLAPKAGSSLTEAQGKATGFYGRALEADQNFTATHAATEPRGLLAQKAADAFPGIANAFTSDDRQLAEQAKRNFILASLRYESGASINADEFEKQDKAFFPQPGDSDAVIAQKAKDRQVVIQGLKEGSGPGAAGMDKHAAAPDVAAQAPASSNAPIDPEGAGDIGFSDQAHMEANSLPQGAQQFQKDLTQQIASGKLKTADDIVNYAKSSALNEGRGFVVDREQAQKALDAFNKGAGVNVLTPDWLKPDISADRGKGGLAETAKAFARGVPAALGADDEVLALADTFQGGTLRDNLAYERAVRDYDEQNHFYPRLAGTLASAYMFPSGAAGAARTAGTEALRGGAGMAAARSAARGAFANRMAMEAGGLAGAYGFGASDGNIGDRLVGGLEGAATGVATAYGLSGVGRLADRFIGRTPPGGVPPTGNAVADAAVRQDVPIIAADAAPGTRGVTALLESIPGSSGVIRNRMQAGTDAIEQRVADIAGPTAADRTGVGEAVQAGAQNWVQRSSDVGGRLYDRAEQLAGGARVNAQNAVAEIDRQIAELSATPGTNAPKLNILRTIRNDLIDTDGRPVPLGINDIRNIRTNARELIDSSQVRSSDLDRRLGLVMDAANADIATGLSANPRAMAAYNRADAFWRDRAQTIDGVLSKVIGKADELMSGEQVMAKIESMAAPRTGNAERLGALLNRLRPDERQQVAGNIAGALGRATPEADFSAQRFFTQVNKLSPRARVAIFGREGADALADLATIAEGRAAAVSKLNNSGSGRVSNWLQTMRGLMGLGGGAGIGAAAGIGATAGAGVTAAGLAGGYATARVLSNPDFARWAAQGFRAGTVDAMRASIRRLTNVASRNPAIKTEVLGIQAKLMEAVNDNLPAAGRAAASPDGGPDQQQ